MKCTDCENLEIIKRGAFKGAYRCGVYSKAWEQEIGINEEFDECVDAILKKSNRTNTVSAEPLKDLNYFPVVTNNEIPKEKSMKFDLKIYRDYLDAKISSLKEMLNNSEVSEEKKKIYKEQLFLLKAMKLESQIFED